MSFYRLIGIINQLTLQGVSMRTDHH